MIVSTTLLLNLKSVRKIEKSKDIRFHLSLTVLSIGLPCSRVCKWNTAQGRDTVQLYENAEENFRHRMSEYIQ